MKIENRAVKSVPRVSTDAFGDYCRTLAKLKVGQSVAVPAMPSHYRLAISILQHVTGFMFASEKEKGGFRVGRIA